jgi:hypothetical protein
MLGCNFYFDDDLMTGIFDSYLYIMRFYIYSDACCVDVKFTALYFL